MDQTTPASPESPPRQPRGHRPGRSARRYATGRQYELRRGDALAVVTELAAGLRLYSRGGTQLTESYGDAEIPPGATGITLAPWANRVEDGIWYLNGKKQQLDITEVSRNNASHGLLRNASYALVDESEFSVTLEAAVFPQHGYPFLLRHRVRYELAEDLGLVVRQTLINDSQEPAPFVLGAHPYLRLGEVPSEELTVTVGAGTRLVTDAPAAFRAAREPVERRLRPARRPAGRRAGHRFRLHRPGVRRRHRPAHAARPGRAQREPLAGRELRLRPRLRHHEVPGAGPRPWRSNR